MFETIKALLDRAPPLLIDSSAGKHLVNLVSKYVEDENIDDDEDLDEDSESPMDSQDEINVKGRQALDLLLVNILLKISLNFFVYHNYLHDI